MATTRNRWVIGALIALGLLVAVVAGGRLACRPPPARPAAGGCGATVDCPPGHRCVAPGKCGRVCKTDGDCPAGLRCAELNLMNTEEEGSSDAGTVTTCVIATSE